MLCMYKTRNKCTYKGGVFIDKSGLKQLILSG